MPLPDRDIRISDADREAAVSSLGRHLGAGRLELSEYEERVQHAYEAKRSHELDALFVDLPRDQPVPARPGRRVGWLPVPLLPVIGLLIALTVATGRPVILALWWLVPIMMFRTWRHLRWLERSAPF
jgi:hypothetical protein